MPLNPAAELTLSDITQFFDERKVSPVCPICSSRQWHLLTPAGEGTKTTRLKKLTPQGPVDAEYPAIPTFLVICTNCNFLREHAAMALGKWKFERGLK